MKSTHTPEYAKALAALVSARKERQVPQVELAKKLGKPQSFVSKYESRERRLDIAEFFVICRALRANPVDVLIRSGLLSDDDAAFKS